MFSDKKDNFVEQQKNLPSPENKLGGDDVVHDLSSDFVRTCEEQSILLCLNEKRDKLLKFLKKDGSEIAEERSFKTFEIKGGELSSEEADDSVEGRLPLELSEFDSEEETRDISEESWREMGESQCNLTSVCGLGEIKESLLNILIYPSLYPQFFPRRIRWNQILLYGPPGTGKTMIANALASEIKGTMHKITCADLLSHWCGENEQNIRNLFKEMQKNSEPKILFIDEIDGLFRRRRGDESDTVRRIKTEFLIHLDEFTAEFGNHRTFLIGATNCPWEIDLSFMRRFHTKIYIPLPDKEARLEIIKNSFEGMETDLSDGEWNEIGDKTEGYSGSELANIVMASCCERFTEVKKCRFWEAKGDLWIPSCSVFGTELNFEHIDPEKVGVRSIQFTDLVEAIGKTPKTIDPKILSKYWDFSEKSKID